MTSAQRTYRLQEAAGLIGIAPITLKRWLLAGKVDEVPRDRNGWRLFRASDIRRIKRYAAQMTPAPTR